MAVPLEIASAFQPGRPKVLFEERYETFAGARNYDVSPDGQRFVMIRGEDAGEPAAFHMVLDWFEDVKARVPR
jgi:hypothetical protein